LNAILQFCFSISVTLILIFSMKYVWFFQFLSDSNVIRLSVDTNTVLSLVSNFCMVSSVLNIASCSAWLSEYRPSNLYFFRVCYVAACEYSYFGTYSLFALAAVCIHMYGALTAFLSFSNCDRVRWVSPMFYIHFPVELVSESFHTFIVLCCLLYFYVYRIPLLHTELHLTLCGRPLLF